MNVARLILREILHRKWSFAVGVLSVLIASGVLVVQLSLLARHDRNTEALVAARAAQTQSDVLAAKLKVRNELAALDREITRITKEMGFNIFILPKGVDLTSFYAEGYASKFMPEDYAHRLATSRIITIQHLLPLLEQKVKWPERADRTIVLVGTRGEVPILQADPKKPILDPVRPGQIVLGYELWHGLGLKAGQKVALQGREFTVSKCQPERGTKDDITVWVHLATAQEMLDKKGLISAILALECQCALGDLAKVRGEIVKILPDTEVREQQTKALARAEARTQVASRGAAMIAAAEADGRRAVQAQADHRAELRHEIERLAQVLTPLTIVGAAAWVGLLAFVNVRQRRGEIGILRAIGFRSGQLAALVLVRCAAVGALGAAAGYLAGLAAASAIAERARSAADAGLFDPRVLAAILAAGPVLSALAGWAPAILAAREDPALVLQEEIA